MLAWLLDEQTAPAVRCLLGEAEVIVASDLTLIECDRVLLRAVALKELSEAEAADRRAHLIAAAAHWQVLRIAAETYVVRTPTQFYDTNFLLARPCEPHLYSGARSSPRLLNSLVVTETRDP